MIVIAGAKSSFLTSRGPMRTGEGDLCPQADELCTLFSFTDPLFQLLLRQTALPSALGRPHCKAQKQP